MAELQTKILWVVQSVHRDIPEDQRLWADEEVAHSKILGYGAVEKHIKHGAPNHFFRLVKRTITEEVEYQGWDGKDS